MAEEEKPVCEECGSENILDVIYEARTAKLCHDCAMMNGAIILKKPTTEQVSKAERAGSIQETVKAWRKQHAPQEASLETLRRRKHELERDREKQDLEKIKKEFEETKKIIDFRSKEVTISDLKKMQEFPSVPEDQQKIELEVNDFLQEVRRIEGEEKLEHEINKGD